MKRRTVLYALFSGAGLVSSCARGSTSNSALSNQGSIELTLVSYSVAKPLYAKLIPAFQEEWKGKTGQDVTFRQSYGSSGAQTGLILKGLEADMLCQNIQSNITPLVERKIVDANWSKRLPNNASPATSAVVIVVRPGNPKGIKNWIDLTQDGLQLVAVNPRTSGNAKWSLLAGYGAVLKEQGEEAAEAYLSRLVANVRTLVNAGRKATDAFIKNRIGDAMINFEHELIFTNANTDGDDYPYIVPARNLQVDFPVTVIDKVVDKRGTRKVAEAFTEFLFTSKAQEIYAQAGYRPINSDVYERYAKQYQSIDTLYTIADFGGWGEMNERLFADGALFEVAQAQAARAR